MQRNVLRRIVVSLFVINIIPFFYFAWIYLWIGEVAREIALDALNLQNILSIMSVFFLSVSVFGFYRFLHLLISIGKGRMLYDLEHFAQSERVRYAVPERVRKIARMRISAKGTSMGVLLYFLLAFIGYLILTLNFAFWNAPV